MNRLFVCIFAALVALATSGAVSGAPSVSVQAGRVVVTNGNHRASIDLSNARIELRTPYQTCHLKTNILYRSDWTEPSRATAKPVVRKSAASAGVTVTYPVADNRELVLKIDAYKGVPGVYILSRLKNLGSLRSEYYFWQWEGGYDSYCVPGEKGIEKWDADPSTYGRFGYSDWVYLPGESGGLAAFTTGTLGRGPATDRCTFLNTLPNTQQIAKDQSLDMGIGLVGAKSPEEAAKLYSILKNRKIPALSVSWAAPSLKGIDYGKPAPKWARGNEVYNIFPWLTYAPKEWTESEIRDWLASFPLMEAVPGDKAVIDRCHKAGLHVVMYVNFMEMLDSAVQKAAGEKGQWYLKENWEKGIGHELVDLHDHPNWIAYDEQGKSRQSVWGVQTNVPGLFNTCFQQADLHKMAIEQLKKVMDLGVDGVFIDNAADVRECCGDKFGRHTHPYPAKTNTQMYMELLREVYKFVKSYGDDKIVMHNSGFRPEQWAFCDVQMAESIIYGSGVRAKMGEWEDFRYAAQMQAEAIKHGKVPVILNYFFDQPEDVRFPHALYTYAYARLYDLGWGDWFTLMGPDNKPDDVRRARELYAVRLGKATGQVKAAGSVYSRSFQDGVVVVNSAKAARTVTLEVGRSGELNDICCDRTLQAKDGKITLELSPESGRVLVWKK